MKGWIVGNKIKYSVETKAVVALNKDLGQQIIITLSKDDKLCFSGALFYFL